MLPADRRTGGSTEQTSAARLSFVAPLPGMVLRMAGRPVRVARAPGTDPEAAEAGGPKNPSRCIVPLCGDPSSQHALRDEPCVWFLTEAPHDRGGPSRDTATSLPLRPAAEHPASHAVLAAPMPRTARHQPLARTRCDKPKNMRFADYAIGYFCIDIAEVRTEPGKLYLLVAMDRTSKIAFVRLQAEATRITATQFLHEPAADRGRPRNPACNCSIALAGNMASSIA